ncbi:hypothetical protein N7539_000176 [Penicillium diatomitis]|uniref:Uncharacterized protein n=1 Tax=Penicillium diatomitis TaxID=2819901 RepID=A0A9W9XM20_9EURO|nr:uncharacterized protein N7539_000176 [Penicillium diatomitis]KAJ5495060.1 hypothetical protein N7539_000176 [Penicillium diatomitis]
MASNKDNCPSSSPLSSSGASGTSGTKRKRPTDGASFSSFSSGSASKKTKVNSSSDVPVPAPTASPCPYTDTFFLGMATAIRQTFPLADFARHYRCSTDDVADALFAVVMQPLCQPPSEDLSVADACQIQIADWRELKAQVPGTCIPPQEPQVACSVDEDLQSGSSGSNLAVTAPSLPSSSRAVTPEGSPSPVAACGAGSQSLPEPVRCDRIPVQRRRWVNGRSVLTGCPGGSDDESSGLAGQLGVMTDAEFEQLVANGQLKALLKDDEEEEADQVGCANPGLVRRRPPGGKWIFPSRWRDKEYSRPVKQVSDSGD